MKIFDTSILTVTAVKIFATRNTSVKIFDSRNVMQDEEVSPALWPLFMSLFMIMTSRMSSESVTYYMIYVSYDTYEYIYIWYETYDTIYIWHIECHMNIFHMNIKIYISIYLWIYIYEYIFIIYIYESCCNLIKFIFWFKYLQSYQTTAWRFIYIWILFKFNQILILFKLFSIELSPNRIWFRTK